MWEVLLDRAVAVPDEQRAAARVEIRLAERERLLPPHAILYRSPIYIEGSGGREVAPETAIPGYAYGSDEAARSPVSTEELDLLKQTVLFSDQDRDALRLAGEVLEDQVEPLLDVW